MTQEFSEKDTEWNFALAYLKRIDMLLQKCNYYKTIQDYNNWLLNLDAVHTEIHPRLESITKEGKIISDESKEADNLFNTAKTQVVLINKGNIDKWIIHRSLSNYERYLRNILRLRGMDMPKKTDPGHSLLTQN
jgi:hypothetical protein